jgi:hypothetical protein
MTLSLSRCGNPDVFRLVKRTVRRPQQNRRDSARGANGFLRLFDLIGGTIVGELRELWVIPCVVAYFMPLGDYPANQFRVSLDVLADQEEGGFEVTRFEQVEEQRRVLGARTIVKRHRQVGTLESAREYKSRRSGRQRWIPVGKIRFGFELGSGRSRKRARRKERKSNASELA